MGMVTDRLRRREKAETRGQEHRYVNVAGGRKGGSQIAEAMSYLKKKGFEKFLDVVPGPLIRSTHGKVLTHMPLAPDSSYTHCIGALRAAYKISKDMPEPDPDFDLEGRSTPKFAHHSYRRTSDKIARESQHLTGATDLDVDETYGWHEAEHAKDQRIRYAGLKARSKRMCVTMMI